MREREGLFVAEGSRLADDFLRAGMQAQFALITSGDLVQQWARSHTGVECVVVSNAVMRELSLEVTPPGILVVFQMPAKSLTVASSGNSALILILDALRDPGNLGACLRVAAGADCRCVLLAPGCVDAFNPKVVRGGMGAHARIQVINATWEDIRSVCQRHVVWMATANGTQLYDRVIWNQPSAVIIGGEASGISKEAAALAHGSITIPLANSVESLNAAVACGVILFEVARQRRTQPG